MPRKTYTALKSLISDKKSHIAKDKLEIIKIHGDITLGYCQNDAAMYLIYGDDALILSFLSRESILHHIDCGNLTKTTIKEYLDKCYQTLTHKAPNKFAMINHIYHNYFQK